jgi:hypothetical protein
VAISQHDNGTRTTAPVEGAFTSLGTDPNTTDGIFQLFVDLSVMQAGDTLVIQAIEKTTGGGDTQRAIFSQTYSGAQTTEPMFVSPTFIFLHGWAFQLKQTAGSARSYLWSIRQVA